MNWWRPDNFGKKKNTLKTRMKIMRTVREYFDNQGFWEVETPALQTMPCADMHIHGFKTEYFGPDLKKSRDYYLHTSPEFEMKKLLVAGASEIYQICKVYRNGESTKMHSPEFTMLEWYRAGADYRDIMRDCEGLLRAVAKAAEIETFKFGDKVCSPFEAAERLKVSQAFFKYAGIDLNACMDSRDIFANMANKRGVRVIESDQWDDIFHAVMAEKIEPELGQGAPTILYEYPASMACLSKKAKDERFAERFELYICGVELANAFTELTDAGEQRKRFTEEMAAKKERYGFDYPLDEDFLSALEYGMPEAGGIALGLDRLIMLACGVDNIENVLWTGKP